MTKQKRSKIKVSVSTEERALLEIKMAKYGYKHISTYLRAAALYENIVEEDITGKQELLVAISALMDLIGDYIVGQHKVLSSGQIEKNDIRIMQLQNENLNNSLNELRRTVIENLSINYTKNHQRQKIKQESLNLLEDGNNANNI